MLAFQGDKLPQALSVILDDERDVVVVLELLDTTELEELPSGE